MKFTIENDFIKQALHWANTFKYCSYCNPNNIHSYPEKPFLHVLAVSDTSALHDVQEITFSALNSILANSNDWVFGHLSYDLKNQIEKLESNNPSFIEFPLSDFFIADYVLFFYENTVEIHSSKFGNKTPEEIYNAIKATAVEEFSSKITEGELGITKDEYINNVNKIIQHIEDGDMYEMNYCINYLFNDISLDPIHFYLQLIEKSPTPFSVFYKNEDKYAIGSSPERFLKKTESKLISQPIKGTINRGSTQKEDEYNQHKLRHDEKEMAENMMIVDLVRNDLAKSSKSGSVKVNEMFGIYGFKHWHQMISTVISELKSDLSTFEIIKNAFPMGSMTGAPKVKVMELIEHYENFKRGLYSGAIGYITPNGDFDFNVVIRTLFYDNKNKKGEFMIGSAITYDSVPEKEFEECLLKAQAIIETLNELDKEVNLNLMN